MATDKPIKNLFTWGDSVTVLESAPQIYRPRAIGDIVGFRRVPSMQMMKENDLIYIYSVEFGDGEAIEIPQHLLILTHSKNEHIEA